MKINGIDDIDDFRNSLISNLTDVYRDSDSLEIKVKSLVIRVNNVIVRVDVDLDGFVSLHSKNSPRSIHTITLNPYDYENNISYQMAVCSMIEFFLK